MKRYLSNPLLLALLAVVFVFSSCGEKNPPASYYVGPLEGTGWACEKTVMKDSATVSHYVYYTIIFSSETEAQGEPFMSHDPLNLEAGDDPSAQDGNGYRTEWQTIRVLDRNGQSLTLEVTCFVDGFAGVSKLEPDTIECQFDDEKHLIMPRLLITFSGSARSSSYTRFK